VVNGVVVVRNGEHTGARPGQALRHEDRKTSRTKRLQAAILP
jgi:N-acyl-D-aspartate/D-glutamate deacylase